MLHPMHMDHGSFEIPATPPTLAPHMSELMREYCGLLIGSRPIGLGLMAGSSKTLARLACSYSPFQSGMCWTLDRPRSSPAFPRSSCQLDKYTYLMLFMACLVLRRLASPRARHCISLQISPLCAR